MIGDERLARNRVLVIQEVIAGGKLGEDDRCEGVERVARGEEAVAVGCQVPTRMKVAVRCCCDGGCEGGGLREKIH